MSPSPAQEVSASPFPRGPQRRNQQQRRDHTIAALIDSTIATIYEVGYANATVAKIAERAGLSTGAMFRYFATREDLVVAAAAAVEDKHLALFESELGDNAAFDPMAALERLRAAARSPANTVMYELLVAGRTNRVLRAQLAAVIQTRRQQTYDLVARHPVLGALPREELQAVVSMMIALFDGEALVDPIYPDPAADAMRMALLEQALASAHAQLVPKK